MTEQDPSPVVEQDSSPAVVTPTAETSAGEAPAGETSAEETLAGDTPAGETSAEETLAAETPAGETLAAETPAGETPAVDAPDRSESTSAEAAGGARSPRVTPTSALEREGEVAADFLEQLLDIADLDGDIDVDVDGDRAAVAIVDSEEGRVSRRLVGTDGKVLDALQELTRLAVQAATGERSRLMLDVAGFRAERRAAVVTVAKAAIATVKSTNQKLAMDSMTAFERKVVHDEVLAAGLVSESEGVEPARHVVILPA